MTDHNAHQPNGWDETMRQVRYSAMRMAVSSLRPFLGQIGIDMGYGDKTELSATDADGTLTIKLHPRVHGHQGSLADSDQQDARIIVRHDDDRIHMDLGIYVNEVAVMLELVSVVGSMCFPISISAAYKGKRWPNISLNGPLVEVSDEYTDQDRIAGALSSMLSSVLTSGMLAPAFNGYIRHNVQKAIEILGIKSISHVAFRNAIWELFGENVSTMITPDLKSMYLSGSMGDGMAVNGYLHMRTLRVNQYYYCDLVLRKEGNHEKDKREHTKIDLVIRICDGKAFLPYIRIHEIKSQTASATALLMDLRPCDSALVPDPSDPLPRRFFKDIGAPCFAQGSGPKMDPWSMPWPQHANMWHPVPNYYNPLGGFGTGPNPFAAFDKIGVRHFGIVFHGDMSSPWCSEAGIMIEGMRDVAATPREHPVLDISVLGDLGMLAQRMYEENTVAHKEQLYMSAPVAPKRDLW